MSHAAADIRLSRFNPLPRILAFDDFDDGLHGWCELVGNHNGDLNELQPVFKRHAAGAVEHVHVL